MREEILRMDRVTYQDGGVTEMHQFCLDVYAGDILGLIPVNDTGLVSLLRLLRQNLPLHYGSVYYRGRRVNRWQQADLSYNRIAVIQPKSGLAADLTVADNVFVMRHGFRKHIISRRILKKQLEPFLQEIGLHLSADTPVRDLSPYHRLVTEIVKAVVADCRLIVLVEPGTVIGEGTGRGRESEAGRFAIRSVPVRRPFRTDRFVRPLVRFRIGGAVPPAAGAENSRHSCMIEQRSPVEKGFRGMYVLGSLRQLRSFGPRSGSLRLGMSVLRPYRR